MDKFLIVGLGNIGFEYEHTRHNIGFDILDHFVAKHKGIFSMDRLAYTSAISLKGKKIICIKPTTYMNLSGKAVNYWMKTLNIPKENVLVLVDDVAIPFEKLRMRPKGSAAGHNGLKNIEELCGGQDYPRLRMGIGDNFPKGRQVDYVLGRFTQQELDALPAMMDKAISMSLGFCTIGIAQTMTQYND